MIAEPQKKCTKCGEEKPLSEFYTVGNGHTSWKGRKSRCKACVKTRTAKHRAEADGREYKPKPDGWGTPRYCELCGKRIRFRNRFCGVCYTASNRDLVAEDDYEPWMVQVDRVWLRCLIACRKSLRRRISNRRKLRDPWYRKLNSICSGAGQRQRRDQQRRVGARKKKPRLVMWSWEGALAWQLKKFRQARRSKWMVGGWKRKFDTMCRNWRRKTMENNHGRRDDRQLVESSREAEVQMCFDWATIDAEQQ